MGWESVQIGATNQEKSEFNLAEEIRKVADDKESLAARILETFNPKELTELDVRFFNRHNIPPGALKFVEKDSIYPVIEKLKSLLDAEGDFTKWGDLSKELVRYFD